ncbi:PD-(D/E)XK nuclease-like domain-containing protein [Streptacidiphilus carbonis]|uniref:PD-(D/E)XK nuclease-like domain-containing protein n=1 Tax=Streptacidiphilus carbonis TaxID=105422 RepID=UPI0005A5DC7D|nr:PD-(D/E)XK nuclease-like domain-containing protein [Streptacidiphilus carbonis]
MTVTFDQPLPLAADREPGVYDDISIEEYHADKTSLSTTGAKLLLPPSCPAKFRYAQDNPQPPKKTFDIGQAAHSIVLGDGPELALVDHERWDTKEAKFAVREARERGAVPLKRGDFEAVHGMADAIRRHPNVGPMFAAGVAERSVYWRHQETGVLCRARPDWLTETRTGQTAIVDLKSAAAADLESLQKALWNFGYYLQEAWYRSGVRAALGAVDPLFIFVFVEKTPPYVVTPIRLDHEAQRIGAAQRAIALNIYRTCVDEGRWPGYVDDIEILPLPVWVERLFN